MGNASAFFSALISTLWTWTLIGLATFFGYRVSQEHNLGEIPGFDLLPGFLRIPLQHQTDSTIVFTLAGVLSGFLLFFLVGYVWQALLDFIRLALVKGSVNRANKAGRLAHPAETPMTWRWFYYPRMTRLWREYAETLHRQTLAPSTDETAPICYRSTVSAETIFSTQALVDLPMRVEFFRHLPGILTGAGIVSTFAGILLGLSEFNPSVEAQQITYQLKNLFAGITTAFIASFFAIFAAILVTVVEKFLLHWRYAQVAALQHYMDDLFRAGIESEYLANLVHHGHTGVLQLQTEVGRLVASMTAQNRSSTQPEVTPATIQPLEPYVNRELFSKGLDENNSIQGILNHFFLDFSRLLHQTVETYGRRRDDGRAFEIKLISAGERLDVAMGELARTVVEARTEMVTHHAVLQDLLQRQVGLLERMDTRLEQVNHHLARPQHAPDLMQGMKEILMRTAMETQTAMGTHHAASHDLLQHQMGLLERMDTRLEQVNTHLAQSQQHAPTLLRGLQEMLTQTASQLPNKADMSDLLTEIRVLRTGMADSLSHPLQEATDYLVQQFARLEQALLQHHLQVEARLLQQLQDHFQNSGGELAKRLVEQFQKLAAHNEQNATLRMQGLAEQLVTDMNATLQARPQTETTEEVAEKVATLLSTRLEQTFGTLSNGLSDLRERFSSERDTLVSTMEGWRADSSRSDKEKDRKIDHKISEVITHVDTHHNHLIQVIDALNQNLSQDLNGMRGGLLNKSEESAQQMMEKVTDLGRVLEEVINTVGQEQTVFIEMLGERLEALRRRLRTK